MIRQISEIVKHQTPVTLPEDATVQRACQCMRDRSVGAVLVTNAGQLVGIFTGRDAISRVLAPDRDAAKTTLAEVMTKNPCILPPGRSVVEALRLMQDGAFRHVPVLDDGRILGVISKGDARSPEYERVEAETVLWENMS